MALKEKYMKNKNRFLTIKNMKNQQDTLNKENDHEQRIIGRIVVLLE